MRHRPLVALAALWLAFPGVALADGHPNKTDVFAGAEAFRHVEAKGVRYDERLGGFRLRDAAEGGYVRQGSFTSEALRYGFGFDRAVLSWNADCPPGSWVRVEVQVSADWGKTWSGWYQAAAWGDAEAIAAAARPAPAADAFGRFNQDTLELKVRANRLRYRVSLMSLRPSVTPLVSLVAIALADTSRTLAPESAASAAWGKELPVAYRSQLVENGDQSYRLCGPAATTMALSTHGVELATKQVAGAAWDGANGIYGNWPYLAAAASALMRQHADALPARAGKRKVYRSFVAWPADWRFVEDEILAGNPVVVSLYWGPGELPGANTAASDGHLMLVRGFTKDGDVICADPAAWNERQGRVVLDRKALHRARHGGPVIVFRPYE